MRQGLPPTLINSMYHSLIREAWEVYGTDDIPVPRLTIGPAWKYNHPATIAETWFADTAYDGMTMPLDITRHAQRVNLNINYIPFLYEDEVIITLVHEIAHVYAGRDAGHGYFWRECDLKLGGTGESCLYTRASCQGILPFADKCPLPPTLGWL